MNEKESEWFITERCRALAWMHLSRRDDLAITTGGRDVGLDYLVSITHQDRKPSTRQFGVVLRGSRSKTTEDHLNKILRPTLQSFRRLGEFPYPVCLLYFTMEDNQGYYTWIAEPVLEEAGEPRLQLHANASCRIFDRDALDHVVSQVNAWYNAFFSSIVVGV